LLCTVLAATVAAGESIKLAESPALSPDGKTLVFSWRGDLWTVPSSGGTARALTFHPARETLPRFSPDGKQLAFVSYRTGTHQVFVMDTEGGAPRQVTFHSEGSAVQDWFPDGKALLTHGARDHFWRRASRFFLKRLDVGSAPVLLFNDTCRDGRVSPDGRHVAFTREGTAWWRKQYVGSQASQVWLYDTAAHSFTKLSAGEHEERWPLWNPDGRRLYVVSQEDGTNNLYEHDLEAGDRRRLTHFKDDGVVFPSLARNGSALVFRRLFDLYRLDLQPGAEPQKLSIESSGDMVHERVRRTTLTKATQAAFSDDGREIAFVAGGDLWVMDTELREPRRVTHTPEDERDPVFAPGHKSIWFVSDKGGQTDLWRARRGDPKRHWWQNHEFELTRITDDPQPESGPRFTPDGRVSFTNLRGDLWTMEPDGSGKRPVLFSWDPPTYSFSPDGKWIAYAVDDNDFNRDIWIRHADGSGDPVNVSRHPDYESSPVWSPDGRLLAFIGERAHRESDIHYVWLRKQDDDLTKRDRTLRKALEKMKGRAKEKPDKKKRDQNKKDQDKKKPKPPKLAEVVIDFDGIADRVHRISSTDSTLCPSPTN